MKTVITGILIPFIGTSDGSACVSFAFGFSLMKAMDVALG